MQPQSYVAAGLPYCCNTAPPQRGWDQHASLASVERHLRIFSLTAPAVPITYLTHLRAPCKDRKRVDPKGESWPILRLVTLTDE